MRLGSIRRCADSSCRFSIPLRNGSEKFWRAAEFELDFDVAQATPYGTSGAAASFGVMASAFATFLVAALM